MKENFIRLLWASGGSTFAASRMNRRILIAFTMQSARSNCDNYRVRRDAILNLAFPFDRRKYIAFKLYPVVASAHDR